MPNLKVLVLMILFMTVRKAVYSQQVDTSYFSTLKNSQYLKYKHKDGSLMGCGMKLECGSLKIVFYSIALNKNSNGLKISGRILDYDIDDSLGVPGIAIYLAVPMQDRLTQVKALGNAFMSGDPANQLLPTRTGDFLIDCHFSAKDRLYFEGELYEPVEFNVGNLLRPKVGNITE